MYLHGFHQILTSLLRCKTWHGYFNIRNIAYLLPLFLSSQNGKYSPGYFRNVLSRVSWWLLWDTLNNGACHLSFLYRINKVCKLQTLKRRAYKMFRREEHRQRQRQSGWPTTCVFSVEPAEEIRFRSRSDEKSRELLNETDIHRK